MKESAKFSMGKRIKSFTFAINGFRNLIRNEHNARIHVVAMFAVIVAGILLKIETIQWISIAIVTGLVFMAELFNTAIEKLADMVEPEWNPMIGQLKDYSAAAVLISAIIAVIVGGLVFIPKIMELLNTFSAA